MNRRITLAAALTLAGLPLMGDVGGDLPGAPTFGVAAQEPRAVFLRPAVSRGWLGIELVHEIWAVSGESSAGRVRVASVVPGGPAEAAGLRQGDLVLSVDGHAATTTTLSRFAAELEPGAETRLLVERDGERRAVTVRAEERPFLIGFDGRPVSPDSVQARIRIQLDSVRHGLERAGAPTPRLQAITGAEGAPLRVPDAEARIRLLLPGASVPPDAAARGPRGIEPLLHRQEFQLDTLVAVIRGKHGEPARVISVRRTPEGAAATTVWPPAGPGTPPRAEVLRLEGAAAPRTLVALGQRAVAGAELADLNPGLAPYFGVEEGVLTVEVVEGTPAHEAGLRPGDVIRTVDGTLVRNVGEVRAAFARGYATPPVRVEIVREGSERTLEFTR